MNLGGVILVEAALSLLLGAGVAQSLTVFSAHMLGDALRDVLDPRLAEGASFAGLVFSFTPQLLSRRTRLADDRRHSCRKKCKPV